MSRSGYLNTPWPGEDGGPARLQIPQSAYGLGLGLGLQRGERLACVTRHTLLSTMTLLGAPGEVYLLTHSALRARIGLPTTACVELIDPLTLKTLQKSPRLKGGPMWPGGMALHRNGNLYVVYGRYAHKLDRACQPLASHKLPLDQAYNSFVILDNGLIVCKNLSDKTNARLSVLDAETLQPACADIDCPEPSIARLSAVGNTVYVVGVRSLFRYHWNDSTGQLEFDTNWRFDYASGTSQTYGWDVVITDEHAWFMDNGQHRYFYKMLGAGVSPTANRLLRVSLHDASEHHSVEVSGLAGGSITNPPLIDMRRRIVIAYDSANAVLRAWRFGTATFDLTPLWEKSPFGCASHMILYPESGELIINDYHHQSENVVVLDIKTGTERARINSGGITQGVVFPSPGWGRDFYWSSMGKLARIFVQ